MKYLVDSDYVADYLKGQSHATTLLESLFSHGLAISIVTFAEVYEGIYYGHHPKHYTMIFHRFLKGVSVLGVTRSVAQRFALIRGDLRSQRQTKDLAQPKDTYDLFIAATALRHHLTLVTRNRKDYERIPNLNIYKAS
jgi:tRNA(fMet)-specific endonuclease VapC